ncbi:MAG: YdcF family protein, partial [Defluviitaleaceae bacterium]|nr:YdcF family protein [Defluviitaleaceae bacterium]
MRKIIFAIGALLLINVILLGLAAWHHGHTIQVALAAAILLYAAFFHKIPRKIHIAIGAACVVPVVFTAFLAIYGNLGYVNYNEDVVIVLGAGLRDGEVGGHLASRLDTALDYLARNPQAMVIVCGGLGANQPVTEAEAMAR